MTKAEIEICLNCKRATCTGYCARFRGAHEARETPRYAYRGEMLTIRELSRRTGVEESTLYKRIAVKGYTAEDAVNAPKTKARAPRMVEAFGERHPLYVWAARSGLPDTAIKSRLQRGWPPERAVTEPLTIRKTARYAVGGEMLTPEEIAERCLASESAVRYRIKQGWTGDQIVEHYRANGGRR